MAKIFKVSSYFIDPNGDYSSEDLKVFLDESLDVIVHHTKIEERDIGEWDDNIILNYHGCPKSECEKYFKEQ